MYVPHLCVDCITRLSVATMLSFSFYDLYGPADVVLVDNFPPMDHNLVFLVDSSLSIPSILSSAHALPLLPVHNLNYIAYIYNLALSARWLLPQEHLPLFMRLIDTCLYGMAAMLTCTQSVPTGYEFGVPYIMPQT